MSQLSEEACAQIGKSIDRECKQVKKLLQETPGVDTKGLNSNIITLLLKGKLRFSVGDYFSALLYYSLCLWYTCLIKKDSKSAQTLKGMVRECRLLYDQQLRSSVRSESDTNALVPAECKQLVDDVTKAPLTFRTIVGLQNEKREILKKFVYPFLYPQLFYQKNNNVLLYGPPGVGKTFIAKASVCELQTDKQTVLFFNVSADNVRSKWEGGTEKNIEEMFSTAQKAAEDREQKDSSSGRRVSVRSVLFLDEVEAIAKSRSEGGEDRAITTLLQQMGGFQNKDKVSVIAATNFPWKLDSAFRRRFSAFVFIDLPDVMDRFDFLVKQIVAKLFSHSPKILCSFYFSDDLQDSAEYKTFQAGVVDEKFEYTVPQSVDRMTGADYKEESSDQQYRRLHYATRFLGLSESYTQNILPFFERSFEMVQGYIFNQLAPLTAIDTKTLTLIRESLKSDKENWIDFLRYIFFIALYTGPSMEGYQTGYVQNRMVSSVGSSYFGYSISDLKNVVNEFFSEMAMSLIDSRFEQISDASARGCRTIQRRYRRVKTGGASFTDYEKGGDPLSDTAEFVEQQGSKLVDMYATIKASQLYSSVNRYPTTVGNDTQYCNYICYQQLNEYQNCTSCLADLKKKKADEE